jgi:hypothetical protein
MLGLGMWVFSAKFKKNYFSYLVAITFTDEKNRNPAFIISTKTIALNRSIGCEPNKQRIA